MAEPLNLTDRTFGDLVAVEPAGNDHTGRTLWRCRCVCGRERIVRTFRLVEGHTTSCGCRLCVECGQRFRDENIKSRRVTCSQSCEDERRKRTGREAYHRKPPEKKAGMVARARKKRADDPEWAHEVDARKYARDMADPKRHARVRAQAQKHYQSNAEKIQAKRKKRKESLSPEERARAQEKAREAGRKSKAKRLSDPVEREKAREYGKEYKKKQQEAAALLKLLAFAQDTEKQLAGEESTPARACRICGKPIIGKRTTAVLCSAKCRREDVRLRGQEYRKRKSEETP